MREITVYATEEDYTEDGITLELIPIRVSYTVEKYFDHDKCPSLELQEVKAITPDATMDTTIFTHKEYVENMTNQELEELVIKAEMEEEND